uniref:Uncharacterized protein n=1 Tax=Parascaris univalens TaxID=6257 RepID=A0A915AN73_PARUN
MFNAVNVLQNLHSLAKQCSLQNLAGVQLQTATTLIRRWNIAPDMIVVDSSIHGNTFNFVLYAFCGVEKDDMLIDFMLTFNAVNLLMNLLDATTLWNTKWFLYGPPYSETSEIDHKNSVTNSSLNESKSERCKLCNVAITSLILHLELKHGERFTPLPKWMLESTNLA